VGKIVNAASFGDGPVAPGSLATIFGTNFSTSSLSVKFDGLPAKILFSNSTQINLLVPPELTAKSSAQLIVTSGGTASAAKAVALSPMTPAIFPGAVLNQDYSVNSAANPAKLGSVIQIFATGLSGTGAISAQLGGRMINTPYYGGPAPGLLGVQQVDLFVPIDLPEGPAQVQVCGNVADARICSPAAAVVLAP
jgi:uncharacterized protein (TIGR03437 family)